jgi:hypothetical protein
MFARDMLILNHALKVPVAENKPGIAIRLE